MSSPVLERTLQLRSRVDDAWRVLDLDAVKHEITALEAEVSAPDFWADQERARRESQTLADLKEQFDRWFALRASVMELQEILELAEAEKDESFERDAESRVSELEKAYLSLEFSMLFSGVHDASNAVLAIHAGAGGTDAQDWAEMLMRMYFRYAEKKGWRVRLVDESRGTEAGIKSATFFVDGRFAFGHLKSEAGVHRLVRLSPFNADQLRQTSFALVEVLPEFDETVEVEIKPDDLRIDTFMSGGKGGQSVNTTYSAVRIVHLPTKITVSCQNERSQAQNKATAMKILKAKLLKLKEEEVLKERQELRGEFHSAEWGNQIRSYVLQPYRMVKDHRTDVETSDTDGVLNGDLDMFIEGYLRHQAEGQDKRAELNKDG
ncbi:MAG TPA: peptide chain release factor 2 [Candidatus Methylomirabilis sp.]|nr:peptide chain release factor 2 [Candidatus Methylomirabilis sp.]